MLGKVGVAATTRAAQANRAHSVVSLKSPQLTQTKMIHAHLDSDQSPTETESLTQDRAATTAPESQFAADRELISGADGVDRTWYLNAYADVAAAGGNPVDHYLRHGWREGRDPRPDFSTSGYLEANEGVGDNPLVHYLRHGGTKVAPPEWQSAVDYDLASGEGGVDRAWYLETYSDIARAEIDPVEHYLQIGWREGRDPRPDFSTSGYLKKHKDIAGNPFLHYLRTSGAADSGETAVTEWQLLWEKGLLYPKGGQPPQPGRAFGARGVPKILFTGHEASRTGAPLILLRLMEALQALTGAELYLLLERGGPLLEDYQRIAHVLVNHHGLLNRSNSSTLAAMLDSIAGPSPQLAICNCTDGWRLVEALHTAGMPHIISLVHERVVHYSADVWQLIHRYSDRVLFPAHAVKAATSAAFPYFEDALVVPQGLLEPEFGRGDRSVARREVRSKLGLSADTAIVLGCGTQDQRKGIDLFLQLAARVRGRIKRKVHFVWIGAKQRDTYFSRFIDLDLSLLNLPSSVSIVGEVSDPETYFLAADAFALTSRDDPFPCVVHEAMACAVPIVAFDGAGGAKEALVDDCGIVVPYLDIEAMADSVISIVKRPSRYVAMGRRAEARVRTVYRFSEYAERVYQICETVLEGRGSEALAGDESIARHEREVPAEDIRALPVERQGKATYDTAGIRKQFRALLAKIGRTIRAEQWWNHKLVPMYAVFYATAYLHHAAVASIWPAAVALLLAIAPCAAYVSLINDLTDRADDHRAGKSNRMAGRPTWQMALLLAAPLCAALAFCIFWRDDLPLVAAYLGSWVAFSLYSIPPFRLKTRGVFGVFADACGSHVFPTLTAALLALRAVESPIDPIWIGTLGVWALGCGLRGILWHQLYDFEADRAAAVQTFVVRRSRVAAVRLARFALLLESVGLAALLWQIGSVWPVAGLLIYAVFALLKSRIWNVAIVIAEPRERYAILGQEYYTALFPFGVLLASALRNPIDWAVVAAHFLVFSQLAVSFVRETRSLAKSSLDSVRLPTGGNNATHHETSQAHTAYTNSNSPDATASSANSGTPTLDWAITKATAFLRERLRSGKYGLTAIGSDGMPRFPDDKGHVFVAWPIAEAMTGLLDEIDRTILLVRILSEEQDGVWGYQSPGMLYNAETLPFLVDSDDSAYVIRTLHRLGVNREPKCLMRFYREAERLFVTWDTPGPVSLAKEGSLRNNFLAHPEVNANIFFALRGTHFEKYVNYDMLLQAQDERGFWKSYFYPSPLYATLLVLDLTRNHPAFASATERALSFIVGSQNADGSWGADSDPHETALAVAALAGRPAHAEATHRGVEYLLSTMAQDGSWASGACIWEAYWTEHDIWRGYDTHRAYISARCLIALRRAAGQLDSP